VRVEVGVNGHAKNVGEEGEGQDKKRKTWGISNCHSGKGVIVEWWYPGELSRHPYQGDSNGRLEGRKDRGGKPVLSKLRVLTGGVP